jgi:small subunit ribosomal protein S16
MVRIRLRREGRKKSPIYRIVIADSQSPREGRFIEIIGTYQPRKTTNAVELKTDRANYWLDVGAQPSDTVRSILRRSGILKLRHETRLAAKLQAAAVPLADSTPDEQ